MPDLLAYPTSTSGFSFLTKNTSDQASKHNKDEMINGNVSDILIRGTNNGPTANPIPNEIPYIDILFPNLCAGVEDVIHVWVEKCKAWSPIPISIRKINQNITLFHNRNINNDKKTSAPPNIIIGL